MNLYAYVTKSPTADMSDEPLGTAKRWIFRDRKTTESVVRKMRALYPSESFKVYRFTEFYRDDTFKLVYTHTSK